jgi:hypothetical protein
MSLSFWRTVHATKAIQTTQECHIFTKHNWTLPSGTENASIRRPAPNLRNTSYVKRHSNCRRYCKQHLWSEACFQLKVFNSELSLWKCYYQPWQPLGSSSEYLSVERCATVNRSNYVNPNIPLDLLLSIIHIHMKDKILFLEFKALNYEG